MPEKPVVQTQRKPPPGTVTHAAPFRHGFTVHAAPTGVVVLVVFAVAGSKGKGFVINKMIGLCYVLSIVY